MNEWCIFKRHGTYPICSYFFKHWEIVKPNIVLLVHSKLLILISSLHHCHQPLLELRSSHLEVCHTLNYLFWQFSESRFKVLGWFGLFFLFVSQSSSHTHNRTWVSFIILKNYLADREFCCQDRTGAPATEEWSGLVLTSSLRHW